MRDPHRRRGNVALITLGVLITLLSIVALSIDGGMLMDKGRQAQYGSDAAAIAAAGKLYYNSTQVLAGIPDPNGEAYAAAVDTANENVFASGSNCTVEVNIPPKSGLFVKQLGYAVVIITYQQPRFFSRIFGSNQPIPVKTRSVARGKKTTQKNAILVLDPSGDSALVLNGSGSTPGTVNVQNAAIQVNSTSGSAVNSNGNTSNSTMTSYELDVTGGINGSAAFIGPQNTGTEPIPDPLAFLIPPDPNTMQIRSTKKLSVSSSNSMVLQPGVYIGGIQITGQANVTMMPGIYYMQGGGFTLNGNAGSSLTGNGVMIYNAPTSTSDVISLGGNGACTLSPMTSGPYQGITLWQQRGTTAPISITGNGQFNISGTFYANSATVNIAGNGTANMIGSQVIAYDVTLGGNGGLNISWSADNTPGIRQVALVE
jgi:hypothetical protein